MTPEKRPQDPLMDGCGLTFEALEHGGEYPDTMPQAIRMTDAQGRSATLRADQGSWEGSSTVSALSLVRKPAAPSKRKRRAR
jgi:hypothetical protein